MERITAIAQKVFEKVAGEVRDRCSLSFGDIKIAEGGALDAFGRVDRDGITPWYVRIQISPAICQRGDDYLATGIHHELIGALEEVLR